MTRDEQRTELLGRLNDIQVRINEAMAFEEFKHGKAEAVKERVLSFIKGTKLKLETNQSFVLAVNEYKLAIEARVKIEHKYNEINSEWVDFVSR